MHPPLEQALQIPEHVRVRLTYSTQAPTTESSLVMMRQFGVPGPYLEEVFILMPSRSTFTLLEAYLEPFELLKQTGAVPQESSLKAFRIETGESPVLAYVVPGGKEGGA